MITFNEPASLKLTDAAATLPAAVVIAGIVALAAWRAGSLTRSGCLAALVIGAIALRASWGSGVLLISWFVLASLLSRWGKKQKGERVRDIVAKPGGRDAWQVLANGAMFALACLGLILASRPAGAFMHGVLGDRATVLCGIAAAAALAAAGADTWATEIGTLYGRAPWSLRTRTRVAAGTSGAVTIAGCVAMVAGAVVIAALASGIAIRGDTSSSALPFVSIAAGGVAGALFDTILGAWAQERRFCSRCELETEQLVHSCGTNTSVVGGTSALDNDVVNFLCTVVGCATAVLVATAIL
jgi:uncharacterized protein (TIGR00297 family)